MDIKHKGGDGHKRKYNTATDLTLPLIGCDWSWAVMEGELCVA